MFFEFIIYVFAFSKATDSADLFHFLNFMTRVSSTLAFYYVRLSLDIYIYYAHSSFLTKGGRQILLPLCF